MPVGAARIAVEAMSYPLGRPLVSVIMPSFNSAVFLPQAVKSVQRQTLEDWELIISDDASSDESLGIITDLASRDRRIRYIAAAKNRGAAHARNAAISQASGRYLAFLDSDDLWKPGKLARQIAFMQENGFPFSFTSYDRMREDGTPVDTVRVSRAVNYRDLLRTNVIGCLTAVYDAAELGKFHMPDIRKRQDYALWLKILKRVDYAYPLEESLAVYRLRSSSVSSNKAVAALHTWRLLRNVEKLPLHQAVYYFAHYAFHGARSHYARR